MKTSNAGLAIIQHEEGLRLKAYRCPAGVWTIGYGHTSAQGFPKVHQYLVITKDEAIKILRDDLEITEDAVTRNVKVPLSQNQFDALVSFVFNVGEPSFKSSTLLKRLNKKDYDSVPSELMKWVRAGGVPNAGLKSRREREGSVFAGTRPVMPQKIDPPRRMVSSREGNAAILVSSLASVRLFNEAAVVVSEASEHSKSLLPLLASPTILLPLVVVIAGVLIWRWRAQRMAEDGY